MKGGSSGLRPTRAGLQPLEEDTSDSFIGLIHYQRGRVEGVRVSGLYALWVWDLGYFGVWEIGRSTCKALGI